MSLRAVNAAVLVSVQRKDVDFACFFKDGEHIVSIRDTITNQGVMLSELLVVVDCCSGRGLFG